MRPRIDLSDFFVEGRAVPLTRVVNGEAKGAIPV